MNAKRFPVPILEYSKLNLADTDRNVDDAAWTFGTGRVGREPGEAKSLLVGKFGKGR